MCMMFYLFQLAIIKNTLHVTLSCYTVKIKCHLDAVVKRWCNWCSSYTIVHSSCCRRLPLHLLCLLFWPCLMVLSSNPLLNPFPSPDYSKPLLRACSTPRHIYFAGYADKSFRSTISRKAWFNIISV